MKLIKTVLIILLPVIITAQENQDDSIKKIVAGVTISINSNGIAPIPSFSLDKPAIISASSISKGRFSYMPALAIGLNLKPWYIDNWVYYKFIDSKKFNLKAGFNYSLFFGNDTISGVHGQRYFTGALESVYQPWKSINFYFGYWYDAGQDEGSIQGHYLTFTAEKFGIKLGSQFSLAMSLQIFYLNYTDKNDGLFLTPRLNLTANKIPLSLFFQATQTLQTNISPYPEFKWNIGLAYSL
ncbi:MAG: hypothetical protein U0W24_01795 [Bacteroidales bacterium]